MKYLMVVLMLFLLSGRAFAAEDYAGEWKRFTNNTTNTNVVNTYDQYRNVCISGMRFIQSKSSGTLTQVFVPVSNSSVSYKGGGQYAGSSVNTTTTSAPASCLNN